MVIYWSTSYCALSLGVEVVHSYGRLILNERVITDKQQLQPPNNDSGDGRIECRVSSGVARFYFNVHVKPNGSTATAVIEDGAFNNFVNVEGSCADIFFYLFLSNGEQWVCCGTRPM